MAAPQDTDKVTDLKRDDEFELLLEEMASILETDEDLTADEGILHLADGDYHDLRDDDVDLGEEYFNLRDGPVVIGAPVVDPDVRRTEAPEQETQEIQLVFEEPSPEAGEHVVRFRMTPSGDRDVLSLDPDHGMGDEEEDSQPSLDRNTIRRRLGKLMSMFGDDS